MLLEGSFHYAAGFVAFPTRLARGHDANPWIPDDLVSEPSDAQERRSVVKAFEHEDRPAAFLPALVQLSDLLVRTRIPNSPADESLMFVLEDHPAYPVVFGKGDLDAERLTFSIDDELEHAVAFVKLAFQD